MRRCQLPEATLQPPALADQTILKQIPIVAFHNKAIAIRELTRSI